MGSAAGRTRQNDRSVPVARGIPMLRNTIAAYRGAALAAASLLGAATLANAADEPYDALPYTPSLDVRAMDRTADPCEDLYTFACGGWKKNNPIPADQNRWSVYAKLSVDNQRYLWGILWGAAKPAGGAP